MGFKVGDKVKHKSLNNVEVEAKIKDILEDGDITWYLLEDGLYYQAKDLEKVED